MTRPEFMGQFTRLCSGFRYESTPEQSEAWFRRVGHVGLDVWSESVTNLLCAERFPRDLDRVLAVVEIQVQACRARAILRDKPRASIAVERLGTVESGIDPNLFQAIKCFAGRQQIRRNRVNWTRNEELEPRLKEQRLAHRDQEEARLTKDIILLMPLLEAQDIRRLMDKYEPAEVPA